MGGAGAPRPPGVCTMVSAVAYFVVVAGIFFFAVVRRVHAVRLGNGVGQVGEVCDVSGVCTIEKKGEKKFEKK